MQKDQGCDVASPDVGAQVQVLMEEYLRLKERDQEECSGPLITHPSSLIAHRDRIVEGMAPLVESIARRYAGTADTGGEAVDDLVSEGYVGLLTAIDQYRVDRGARFSTYATHRVHGQIRHYLRDRGNRRLIRAPSWLQELLGRLQKEEAKLQAELGRLPTTAELAERLNLLEEAVDELKARGLGPAVLSLTEGSGDDEDGGGVDLGKFRHLHYVSWQLPIEDQIFLDGLMVRLKELERKVITLFFYQDLSQSEIARSMDISCNYVGYLLKNGLRKLRSLIEADELRDAQLRVCYAPRRISKDASIMDAATGLYNADYFRVRLAEELARACRYRHSLALLVFRIADCGAQRAPRIADCGLSGNDGLVGTGVVASRAQSTDPQSPTPRRRGRPRKNAAASGASSPSLSANPQSGDPQSAGLTSDGWRELGTALRECLRKADVPARLDEESMVVALPHTGEAGGVAAGRMSELLSQVGHWTVTAGLAVYPDDGTDTATLLEVAASRARGGDRRPPDEENPPQTTSIATEERALACAVNSRG